MKAFILARRASTWSIATDTVAVDHSDEGGPVNAIDLLTLLRHQRDCF